MAKVKKIGRRYCVTHSTTGATIKRGGRPACYATRKMANQDANKTKCRVMGVCPR